MADNESNSEDTGVIILGKVPVIMCVSETESYVIEPTTAEQEIPEQETTEQETPEEQEISTEQETPEEQEPADDTELR